MSPVERPRAQRSVADYGSAVTQMAVTFSVQVGVPVWFSRTRTVQVVALAGPFWNTKVPVRPTVEKPPPMTLLPAAQVAVTVLSAVVLEPEVAATEAYPLTPGAPCAPVMPIGPCGPTAP